MACSTEVVGMPRNKQVDGRLGEHPSEQVDEYRGGQMGSDYLDGYKISKLSISFGMDLKKISDGLTRDNNFNPNLHIRIIS